MNKQSIIWISILGILLLSLVSIIFPKTIYDEENNNEANQCQCFGSLFWYGTKCVGIPYNCTQTPIETVSLTCEEPSCADIAEQLRESLHGRESDILDNIGIGTDVILAMDSSNSMEGDKLLAAKRAAQQLVDDLQQGERIGVISFSESSMVIHEFSDDKQSLTEGIMGITVSGGTNFIPALDQANDLVNADQRRSRRGIIFFSDGIPSDDPEEILEKARLLRGRDIPIFAISFGIDEQEENILKEMVRDDNDPESVNRWYREFTDIEDLIQAFSEAWDEITMTNIIDLAPAHDKDTFDVHDLSGIGVWTQLETLMLTSDTQDDQSLCIPDFRPELIFTDSERNKQNVTLVAAGHKYVLPPYSLSAGTYEVEARAVIEANHNGSCSFIGEEQFDDITITNMSGGCDALTCEALQEHLDDFDLALQEEMVLPREDGPGRVVVLMDTSESMRLHLRQVSRAINRLSRLLSPNDYRALITFAEKAHLDVPLTRDEEKIPRALDDILPQGTTRMIPALQKAGFVLHNGSDNDIIMVFTDGMAYDDEGYAGVEQEARQLVDKGVCLFFFSYGTGIIEEKETLSLFRSLAEYSRQRLGCGGFSFDPNSEDLSLIVTEMFGGERKDDTLEVIVEIDKHPVFSRTNNKVSVYVISAKTGLRLPVSSPSLCIPEPSVEMRLEDGRGREVSSLPSQLSIDGKYVATLPHLMPGRYRVIAEAVLPPEECGFSSTYEKEFVTFGSLENNGEFTITLLIMLIAGLILFVIRQARKSF